MGSRNKLLDAKTLEVASFVLEQERLNEYKRPPWRTLYGQWNREHPEDRFDDHRHFRQNCMRGVKAVTKLDLRAASRSA